MKSQKWKKGLMTNKAILDKRIKKVLKQLCEIQQRLLISMEKKEHY